MSQVCADCGAPTEVEEDFCGECGAYLEWEERAAPVPEPVPEPVTTPAPAVAPPKLSLIRRVVAPLTDARPPSPVPPTAPNLPPQARTVVPPAPGVPPTAPPAGPPPGPPPTGAPGPRPTGPPPAGPPPSYRPPNYGPPNYGPPPAGPPPSGPPPAVVSRQAGPPQPRVSATAPQGSNPAPVQPGVAAPRPTRRPQRDTDQPLEPGDLICGQCGAGNKPTRKFCRRCGHDLVDAPVVKVPWWRRIFRRRPKAAREAGTRPRRMRTAGRSPRRSPRRLITLLLLVGLVGGGGYFARGYVRSVSDVVVDRVKGTEPVNPTGMTASSSLKGHGPGLARDGATDTYWAPAKAGSGKGEFLVTKFGAPFRLVYVLITPGVHGEKEDAYLRGGRPKELRLVLTSKDGSNRVKTIELDDKLGSDQFHITGNNIVKVKLEIVSSYPGSVAGSPTAITEVEFRARK